MGAWAHRQPLPIAVVSVAAAGSVEVGWQWLRHARCEQEGGRGDSGRSKGVTVARMAAVGMARRCGAVASMLGGVGLGGSDGGT